MLGFLVAQLQNTIPAAGRHKQLDSVLSHKLAFDLGGVEVEPAPFNLNQWYGVKVHFDCDSSGYDVWLDGRMVKNQVELDARVSSLERVVFRTGAWRSDVRAYFIDGEPSAPGVDGEDLAAAGEKVAKSVFWIDNVKTSSH